jgi:hypothetical protein
MVELRDNKGGRLIREVRQGFELITENESVQAALNRIPRLVDARNIAHGKLADLTKRFDAVVSAATMTIRAIMDTSRLGRTSQGANIRIILADAVIKALPEGDSRIEELERTMEKGPTQRPPKGK